MPEPLEYRTPDVAKPKSRSPLARALRISAFEHIGILGVATTIVDGGEVLNICAAVSAAFWLLALVIAFRKRKPPTKAELTFIVFGYPIMLAICIPIRIVHLMY